MFINSFYFISVYCLVTVLLRVCTLYQCIVWLQCSWEFALYISVLFGHSAPESLYFISVYCLGTVLLRVCTLYQCIVLLQCSWEFVLYISVLFGYSAPESLYFISVYCLVTVLLRVCTLYQCIVWLQCSWEFVLYISVLFGYSAPEFQSRITPNSTPEKEESINWPENINNPDKKIGKINWQVNKVTSEGCYKRLWTK